MLLLFVPHEAIGDVGGDAGGDFVFDFLLFYGVAEGGGGCHLFAEDGFGAHLELGQD